MALVVVEGTEPAISERGPPTMESTKTGPTSITLLEVVPSHPQSMGMVYILVESLQNLVQR